MHLTTSSAALRVASRIWPTARGGWALTLICKATYRLQPGESPLHENPEPVHEDDAYWNDDPSRSLAVASDLAPFKPRADVVLVGSAYASQGYPARSIVARLIVGDLDKSLEAWADRTWTLDGQLREGPRVPKVSLRYERAAGGPDSWNHAGVRPDAIPNTYGQIPLPNLQPPGLHITRREDFIPPIGFGPIAPTWPLRWTRLGPLAGIWPHDRWWQEPLPEGFDPTFFNVAPTDQQLPELHDNERLVLEHLHPEHPRLVTSLLGLRPRAVAERGSMGREDIPLLCDTLWIDTDRALCTLVWRGRLSLIHAEDQGRITITAERAAASSAPHAVATPSAPGLLEDLSTPPRPPTSPDLQRGPHSSPSITDLGGEEEEDDVRTLSAPLKASRQLPAVPASAGEAGQGDGQGLQTTVAPLGVVGRVNVLPFAEGAPSLEVAVSGRETDLARPPFSPRVTASTVTAAFVEPTAKALPFSSTDSAPAPQLPPVEIPRFTVVSGSSAVPPWVAPLERAVALPAPTLPVEMEPRDVPPPPPLIGPLSTPEMLARDDAPDLVKPAQAQPSVPSAQTAVVPITAPQTPAADVTLERCAAITARIACNKEAKSQILEGEGISADGWSTTERRWTDAIRAETSRGKQAQLHRFDAAYVAQLELERGRIVPEDYARISVAGERGTLDEVLTELALPRGSIMKIERVWLQRMAEEPALAEHVRVAIDAARERV
ncbi:DUF2169 family type VI secretion system accessory protein [Chondromyces apiculatus]|uniref:DUF2169 domain-containing protein n=1 Tax=Chondromyces apiculatus DSM 436 TaxID=1192034 RepID=A0A017SWF3_9BACT|nr:DUF2169 domain-containing protein [Chondromyces apiculatus]EYF01318.1 Hypothetical protein CAP_8472 [Chondromyces apiculatus DSM 436]